MVTWNLPFAGRQVACIIMLLGVRLVNSDFIV